jgi:hypothetical protein
MTTNTGAIVAGEELLQPEGLPPDAREYLGHRLDGARDLYLLALALGDRREGFASFGRMIREARIHFAAVIEEARIAGLDTSAIAQLLGKSNFELSIRPDLWARVQQLLAEAAERPAQRQDPR